PPGRGRESPLARPRGAPGAARLRQGLGTGRGRTRRLHRGRPAVRGVPTSTLPEPPCGRPGTGTRVLRGVQRGRRDAAEYALAEGVRGGGRRGERDSVPPAP